MSDNKKVQLEFGLDASGVKQGLEEVKQSVRDVAQTFVQQGQQAGKGLDAISDGANRAADGMTRSEGRMTAAIRRSTVELQTLGKSLSQKFEAKIDLQGLDPAKFTPMLEALRQAEREQERLQQGAKGAAFIGDLQGQIAQLQEVARLQGLSANEALRYKAALLGAGDAADPLIAELGQLKAAQEAAARAARDEAEAQKAAARAVADRDAFVSRVTGQANSIGKSQADLLQEEAARRGVTQQLTPYIAKIREAEQAHRGLAASGKLTAFQTQQLGFQMHDFAVQVASGQSALTAFVQQGSQLSGTFGGAGNALRAVGTLITPMTVAIGGAVAAFGALALAMGHAESAARTLNTLQAQLTATGQAGQFSGTKLKEFIRELERLPGVSREAATQIVSEFSKINGLSPEVFRDLAKRVPDFAKATGTDEQTAARTLGQAFANPEKGSTELAKTLDKFPSSALLAAKSLAEVGKSAEAQVAMLRGLDTAIKGTAQGAMTPLQDSVDKLGTAWRDAMLKFDQSDALKRANDLLVKIVGSVAWLIENVPKIPGAKAAGTAAAGTALATLSPGIGHLAVAANAAASFFGPTKADEKPRSSSGKVGGIPAAAGVGTTEEDAERAIKKGLLDAEASGFKSQAGELEKLAEKRKYYNGLLAESSRLKKADEAKEFRETIAGIDKKVADIKARKSPGAREFDQTRAAALQADLQAFKDKLQEEREAFQFHDRLLQAEFNAGTVSVKDFYDRKRQIIADGVAAEVRELQSKKGRLQDELQVEKDPSSRRKLEGEIAGVDRDIGKAEVRGARETELANKAMEETYRQLSDQVSEYRANLLQMAGDEAGAARIRLELAAKQDLLLAKKVEGRPGLEIKPETLQRADTVRRQNVTLERARSAASVVNQALELEEERIAAAQRRGAVGEIEALAQVGEARRRAVPQLEEIVKKQEEIAGKFENRENWQLQIDTARARQDLERFKSEALDPLAEKFRGMFEGATGSAFEKLLNGDFAKRDEGKLNADLDRIDRDFKRKTERIKSDSSLSPRERDRQLMDAGKERDAREKQAQKDAVPGVAGQVKAFLGDVFKSLSAEMNSLVAKNFSQWLFAKEGPLGDLPGGLSKIFTKEGKPGDKPLVDTSGITSSLNSFQTTGLAPATAALGGFTQALQTAAGAAGSASVSTPGAPLTPGDFARLDRQQAQAASLPATAGDFARMDRALQQEQAQAQAALEGVAKQGAEPATTALLRVAPAAEAAATALAKPDADAALMRVASAANAAAEALQRIAGIQPGAPGSAVPSIPGIPGVPATSASAPTFGIVDTAPGGERVRFGEQGVPPNPFAQQGAQAAEDATRAAQGWTSILGDASKTTSMATTALSLFAMAAGKGNSALALLPSIIQMIITAASASSAAGAAGGGGGLGGIIGGLGSIFGGGGAAAAAGESFLWDGAGQAAVVMLASSGGYTGDADASKAVGIVHGQEYVFSAPAVKTLGKDVLHILHDRAKQGDGGSVARILRSMGEAPGSDHSGFSKGFSTGGYTGDLPPDQTAGVVHGQEFVFSAPAVKALGRDVLHILHDKAREGDGDKAITTVMRLAGGPEGVKPAAPRSMPAAFAQAVESDSSPVAAAAVLQRSVSPALPGVEAQPMRPATAALALAQGLGPRAGLKPNEVPAVLMGGPKGVREEVLTADDPRHADNLSPGLRMLVDRMPRYHEGGIVSTSRTAEYLMPKASQPSAAESDEGQRTGKGPQQVFHINVTATPETTRATAKQTGVNVMRGLQTAAGSNR